MKKIILYFTFLNTLSFSPKLLAQHHSVKDISWSIAAKIPAADQQTTSLGLAGAVIGIIHRTILIAGGTNFPNKMPWYGGKKSYYNDIFLYQKTSDGLRLILPKTMLKLPFNLAYSAVCSTSYGIVVAGGENENGLSKRVLLLNCKGEELELNYLPDLPMSLTNAALTVIGDQLYMAGGETENGVTDQFLSLNLNEPQKGWVKLINLPKQVSHTVLLSAKDDNGKEIFLVGGRKRNEGDTSTIYKEVYAFSIEQQVWQTKKSLPYPLSAAAGIINGKSILVFSGDKGETFHKAERLIAEIGREKDEAKKEVLNQKKTALQSNHPGFSKTALEYNLITEVWSELKTTMPYGPVTTNAVQWGNKVIIVGGEVRAGVRTPDILIGKIKESR